MELLYILVLGYAVNILVLGILMFLTLINTLINTLVNVFNPEYQKDIMYLNSMMEDIKAIKQQLRDNNLSTRIQEDYIIYVPFAYLLRLVMYIYGMVTVGLTNFLYDEIVGYKSKLETRLTNKRR